MRTRFARTGGVAVVLMVAGLLGACDPPPPDSYVALGDSYTSGPAMQPLNPAVPGCYQSEVNYPSLVAPDLGFPAHRDVSCSGAQTKDMEGEQKVQGDPDNPPQLTALDSDTRVVTMSIGGNDIGFTDIATTCGRLGLQRPTGSPCKDFYTADGVDENAQAIAALAPDLVAVLDGIEARSPEAKVFVVGYPAILPETTDAFLLCRPFLPVAEGDVAYLRDDIEKRLNATIQYTTVANGHVFVDTYGPSIGKDACKTPETRWVEPVVPVGDTFPVHPNRRGMQGIAAAVRASMVANGVRVGG